MQFLSNRIFLASALAISLLSACKKDMSTSSMAPPQDTTSTTKPTASDLAKDSVLAYSKDIYLWYNQIPSSFNARSYDGPDKIMTAIRQYSMEPGFTTAVDRWSFAMKQQEWDKVSSGVSGDFGLNVFFRSANDLRVKAVEKASPAGRAGIRRGWQIVKINGNSNISTSNTDFIVTNVFNSTATTFTFQKPDNTTVDVSLNAGTYQEHPVILDSVYAINGKKIGYFSFNSFLGDTTEIYNEFNRITNRFAAENVNDVIIDLRYNGGGYVSVQQKLANYLAPLAANGNIMMKQQYNDKYTQYNSTDNFKKLGALNLSRIFFIVSNSTASASELLINNLRPYMDVELVGPSKTYGKPVGFFPIPVADWYIFPVSFRSTNKNGEGAYFNGLTLNYQVADGLDKDWGDLTESCLASAVNYITTGVYRTQARGAGATFQEQPEVKAGNNILDKPSFKGAIGSKKLK